LLLKGEKDPGGKIEAEREKIEAERY